MFEATSVISPMTTTRKSDFLLIFFVTLKIVVQYFVINPVYELHRDEYLHLDQSNHLAWGYSSVPPLTSWIALLIKWLGNSVFWVKLFPALFGALTLVVVWLIIKELCGTLKAQIVSSLALIFSGLTRIDMLFQPNSFDILCWTTIYFFLIKFIHTNKNSYLLLLGLTVGLGVLNKYNICFLLSGLLPALLLSPQRKIFSKRYLYYAIGLALLIVLPNLIWQIQNSFPVMHHLKELTDTQLVNVSRKEFLFSQLLLLAGSDIVWLAALVAFIVFVPFKSYRVVGWSFVFTILIFSYLKGKSYYAFGLYPVLIAFGCVYLESVFAIGWKKYLLPALAVLNLLVFVPFLNAFPFYTPETIEKKQDKYKKMGLLKWEDGKDHSMPQDFADMLGWKELAEKTQSAFQQIPESSKNKTLILCDNYGQAGAINFYNQNKIPSAVSFNADYLNWFPVKMKIENVIAIKEAGDTISEKEKKYFKTITLADKIQNRFAREYGTEIYILTGGDDAFTETLYKKMEEGKNNSTDITSNEQ
jgi:hypothetical protein